MSQSSFNSSQDIIKAPTTLDKIPEDVQLAIIKFIQSWKRSEGTEQEREKGKRVRDSALRAVALSCRKLLSIYRRELLLDVTCDGKNLLSLYLGTIRNQDSGKLIRAITFTDTEGGITPEYLAEAQEDLSEALEALRDQGLKTDEVNFIECLSEGVYQLLPNIQSLVVRQPQFNIPLQSKWANARIAPLPFLTHSLKKLFIPMWVDEKNNFKARNVAWILVFCTGLRSATLGCVFGPNDFKYLSEFSDSFSGLSKVSKLALGADFSANKSIERYWERGVGKQWIGGNRKSEAVYHLLKVTKNLQCLEINNLSNESQETSSLRSSCLSAVRSSYLSLESLRLFGMGFNSADREECKANANFSLFQNLQVISLDSVLLFFWSKMPEIEFPPGLKVLRIPYYNYPSIHEDLELARAFKVRSFPSLEKVAVPSKPIQRSGVVLDSDDFMKQWLKERRELEKAEIFQSGKAELSFVEPGEFIREPSETDFNSLLIWSAPT